MGLVRPRVWIWPSTDESVLHLQVGRLLHELDPATLDVPADLRKRLLRWVETFMDQGPMWEWDDPEVWRQFVWPGFG